MKSILERLQHPNIEIIVFSESMILNDPIKDWPICDCLIAFFSVGFPLDKAVKYTKLRKPLLINDLESQYDLLDRCECVCMRACVFLCVRVQCACVMTGLESKQRNIDIWDYKIKMIFSTFSTLLLL